LDKQCINYKVLLCILPDFELRKGCREGCREDLKNLIWHLPDPIQDSFRSMLS
jgi:hypothetical protein